MLKIIQSLAIVFLLVATAQASPPKGTLVQLRDTTNTEIEDYAMTSGVPVQSKSIYIKHNVGFATLIVTEDIAGGAGDIDIYAEYSDDQITWYRAYDSDMGGVITQEGNIVTALQNVSRWIVYTPRLAIYTRIVFDPDANSEVTAVLIFQEEK